MVPNIMVVVGYNDIYGDYTKVNVPDLLKGIPTLSLLHYITEQTSKVIYSFGNQNLQRTLLHEMSRYLPKEIRKKVQDFMWHHKSISFLDFYGCTLLLGLALQNFYPHAVDDNELPLCQDEYEAVFKAILYCNQRWTNEQSQELNNRNCDIIPTSIRLDLPIVEFKLHKDFIVQIYKVFCFFKFCENDKEFSIYLQSFCENKSIKHWEDYILRLFEFFETSLKSQYIKVSDNIESVSRFFDKYVVDIDDCKDLWDGHNALQYFRNHFLLKITCDTYLLLNANLLIDKLYQGMKFDFYREGKTKYKSYPDFNSDLGTRFSEPHLLYRLMQKIYSDNPKVSMFTGEQLKQKGVVGEPDMYLRIGDSLFLFEYKDVTLGDNVKYSRNFEVIKEGICDRICKYDDRSKKGAGQLLYTIERIFQENLMTEFDPSVTNVSEVYPIILTTDRSFSAIGVNALVTQEFSRMKKDHPINKKIFISIPIIVELDTIILCAKELHDKTTNLREMLKKYLRENSSKLIPFSTYMYDNYLKKKKMELSEIELLFGDLFS